MCYYVQQSIWSIRSSLISDLGTYIIDILYLYLYHIDNGIQTKKIDDCTF